MAAMWDPDKGATVYADALGTIQFARAKDDPDNGRNGGVITPTPSIEPIQRSPEALTSEHGGGNEPSPPLAGTRSLATNLDRQLAQLAVSRGNKPPGTAGSVLESVAPPNTAPLFSL